MKLKRNELIKTIEQEIARRELQASLQFSNDSEDYLARRASHVAQQKEAWQEMASNVLGAVTAEIPVTRDMFPVTLWEDSRYFNNNRLNLWNEDAPSPAKAYLGDLPAIRDLLNAVTDDEVTTAELARLGFRIPKIFTKD